MDSNITSDDAALLAEQLVNYVRQFDSAAIALSGGVDSAVVAAACFQALGARCVAITGIGAAVSSAELTDAQKVAKFIGIQHVELRTLEIEDPKYVMNDSRRCFYCKSTLYSTLSQYALEHGFNQLVSGTNHDDLGDYRPGLEAGANHQVRTPLADLGFSKAQVRLIAGHFQLPVTDKPSSPCLASRIAYGESVTPIKLSRIEKAEAYLKQRGFYDVRVRHHADDLARLELHPDEIRKVLDPEVMQQLTHYFQSLGFKFITVDLGGRQTGSLNRVLPVIQ